MQGSTDGVYIFRRLLGLEFIVPTAFRDLDNTILDDASIEPDAVARIVKSIERAKREGR